MINRNSNVNELAVSFAEIGSRTEALKQQVSAFHLEFSQVLKNLAQDFWKLRFVIEEAMKNLDAEGKVHQGDEQ